MEIPGHLRGFPAPGLTRDDHDAVALECVQKLLPVGRDGQAALLLPEGQVAVLVVDVRRRRWLRRGGARAIEAGLCGRVGGAGFPECSLHDAGLTSGASRSGVPRVPRMPRMPRVPHVMEFTPYCTNNTAAADDDNIYPFAGY